MEGDALALYRGGGIDVRPIVMTPFYRHGQDTPWGGEELRAVFGKDIPDSRTGESLEASAIPGLESADEQGVPLSALIAKYGDLLLGTQVRGDFPLLLKMIDARDKLSVQVHPDDAYAARHEGKMGKTEAWVILRAAPGAQIVYGVRAGVTRAQLRVASLRGEGVEALLRFVPARAGDVFHIPAGMVHAIGAGILLYEVQQSSDVTYRFYDWNRTDAQGSRRALHIDKAVDVTDVSLQADVARPTPVPAEGCACERLLDGRYFSLRRLTACQNAPLALDSSAFALLTALADGAVDCPDGARVALRKGQTALLPAACGCLSLRGEQFLLAAPGV